MARVLIIDDDQCLLDTLRLLLQAEKHEPTTSLSAVTALEIVKTQPIDMIICDMRMNPMDGLEFLRQLREFNTTVPIVMLTAYGSPQTAKEASELGAFDYLSKPFVADEVLDTIRRALESAGTPPDEPVS